MTTNRYTNSVPPTIPGDTSNSSGLFSENLKVNNLIGGGGGSANIIFIGLATFSSGEVTVLNTDVLSTDHVFTSYTDSGSTNWGNIETIITSGADVSFKAWSTSNILQINNNRVISFMIVRST